MSADVATGRTQGFGPALLNRALGSDTARLALLVAAGCAVLAMLKPNFLTDLNAYVLLRGIAITLIVAFAQLVVLAIGQLSLSVGAIGGMTAVLTGGMMEVWGVATPAAIGAGLLVGVAAGLVNGLLITRTGINGFVITLATASAFTGITIGLNNAEPFYNLPPAFVAFGQARLGPVPAIGVVTILVTLALSFLFRRTVLGRQILAVGGNPRSAALSGIRVDPIIVITHTLSGSALGDRRHPAHGAAWLGTAVDRLRLAAAIVRDSHCRRRRAQRRRGADRVDGAGRLFDRPDREWSGPRQSRPVLDPVSAGRHHSGSGGAQPSAPRVYRWLISHRDTGRVTATAPRLSEDQAISPAGARAPRHRQDVPRRARALKR